jgi:hypothetical protein
VITRVVVEAVAHSKGCKGPSIRRRHARRSQAAAPMRGVRLCPGRRPREEKLAGIRGRRPTSTMAEEAEVAGLWTGGTGRV